MPAWLSCIAAAISSRCEAISARASASAARISACSSGPSATSSRHAPPAAPGAVLRRRAVEILPAVEVSGSMPASSSERRTSSMIAGISAITSWLTTAEISTPSAAISVESRPTRPAAPAKSASARLRARGPSSAISASISSPSRRSLAMLLQLKSVVAPGLRRRARRTLSRRLAPGRCLRSTSDRSPPFSRRRLGIGGEARRHHRGDTRPQARDLRRRGGPNIRRR